MATEEPKEQLLELLVGYTKDVGDFTGTIADWIQQEAPELAHQIVIMGRIESTIDFLIGLSIVIFVYWLLKKMFTSDGCEGETLFFGSIGLGILGFFGGGLAIASLHNLICAWCAPKLFILDYIRDLV